MSELSEKEKEAIDKLKRSANYFVMPIYETKIILNLIENQQKEIKELNNLHYDLGRNFIDLDIKCKKQQKYIEELKEEREYLNCIIESDKDNYINKNKIKAKIEECEKEKNIPEEMDFKAFYRIKDLKNIEIKVLQSLLKEE